MATNVYSNTTTAVPVGVSDILDACDACDSHADAMRFLADRTADRERDMDRGYGVPEETIAGKRYPVTSFDPFVRVSGVDSVPKLFALSFGPPSARPVKGREFGHGDTAQMVRGSRLSCRIGRPTVIG